MDVYRFLVFTRRVGPSLVKINFDKNFLGGGHNQVVGKRRQEAQGKEPRQDKTTTRQHCKDCKYCMVWYGMVWYDMLWRPFWPHIKNEILKLLPYGSVLPLL